MASSPTQPPLDEPPNDDTAAPAPQIPDNRNRSEHLVAASPYDNLPFNHRCFVCLVDEAEATLPADWSTPCACTLEGHQECLMAWVTDLEAQGKEVKCPICKSPIVVTEQWDFAIQLSNYLNRTFSIWSSRILFGFVASGALVSSSIYGAKAIDWFAGTEATMNFLLKTEDITLLEIMRQQADLRDRHGQPPVNVLHFAVLPLIAPGLVLNRMEYGEFVLIPASLLYSLVIDQTSEYLSWPPSPQRALALYPTVQSTYFYFHRTLSKSLERKWEAKARQLEHGASEPAPAPDHIEPQAEPGNLLHFGIDVAIGLDDEDEGADNNNRRNRAADRGGSPFNFLAGTLVWPGVCCGMGELLRLVLPSRFVARPPTGASTGILQERWGRSLVGGCLFVVLKDAFFLWVKYRRTMNRSSRHIKNAANRNMRR
ncbi:hypothetical protein F4677DRAFT_434927 [Hypoxylon crocopeplum]|nr:hypothetical protein F4677DRAFT_434927 [Hypoxylon crocopeplum]